MRRLSAIWQRLLPTLSNIQMNSSFLDVETTDKNPRDINGRFGNIRPVHSDVASVWQLEWP